VYVLVAAEQVRSDISFWIDFHSSEGVTTLETLKFTEANEKAG